MEGGISFNAPRMRAHLQKSVNEADKVLNPLHGLEAFLTHTVESNKPNCVSTAEPDMEFHFHVEYKRNLTKRLHKSCMDLFQQNMTELYRVSNWGLNLSRKAKELKHERARFLVITNESTAPLSTRQSSAEIIAFSHFRYELDDDEQPKYPVLYVYELQVKQEFQRHGLGKKLMTLMELMALRNAMAYVMLTVFKHNTIATTFYLNKMRYSIADQSPSKCATDEEETESVDYEILWKLVSKKK